MSFQSVTYFVLIGSPGDLKEDRDEVEKQIHRWNVLHAEDQDVTLIPLRWETGVRPTYGADIQASINDQIVEKADALIGMFWHRIGTKTEHAESGTFEEIEKVANAGREVMLYFSDRPVNPSLVTPQQLKGLAAFKKATRKAVLTKTYDALPALREMVFDDISRRRITVSIGPDQKSVANFGDPGV